MGKECKYAHAPQAEPSQEPQGEIEANATEIGLRSMATIGQMRAAEDKASEIEANAAIAHYLP